MQPVKGANIDARMYWIEISFRHRVVPISYSEKSRTRYLMERGAM